MTQGQDLLTGSVPKKLIRFAFPLFLANLLQALYNVVDMLVVGRFATAADVSAVSTGSWLMQLITSFVVGIIIISVSAWTHVRFGSPD